MAWRNREFEGLFLDKLGDWWSLGLNATKNPKLHYQAEVMILVYEAECFLHGCGLNHTYITNYRDHPSGTHVYSLDFVAFVT